MLKLFTGSKGAFPILIISAFLFGIVAGRFIDEKGWLDFLDPKPAPMRATEHDLEQLERRADDIARELEASGLRNQQLEDTVTSLEHELRTSVAIRGQLRNESASLRGELQQARGRLADSAAIVGRAGGSISGAIDNARRIGELLGELEEGLGGDTKTIPEGAMDR